MTVIQLIDALEGMPMEANIELIVGTPYLDDDHVCARSFEDIHVYRHNNGQVCIDANPKE